MDSTYKVNKSRFPFLVFGRSDYSGQFHPIAVALMKREGSGDYHWFLNYIISFCLNSLELKIENKILYFMIDASDAEFNAVQAVFPNSSVLRCWFHFI